MNGTHSINDLLFISSLTKARTESVKEKVLNEQKLDRAIIWRKHKGGREKSGNKD